MHKIQKIFETGFKFFIILNMAVSAKQIRFSWGWVVEVELYKDTNLWKKVACKEVLWDPNKIVLAS